MAKLKSKPAIKVNGPKNPHRDASLFIVACEGEKTESIYLNFPFLVNSRVKILVLPSEKGLSAPVHILENLRQYVHENRISSNDQLWLVADKDKWPYENQLRKIQNKTIKRHPIRLAISNPCFELFLYLHFAEMPATPILRSKDVSTMIRKVCGSYSKTHLIASDYQNKVQHAISESKKTVHTSNNLPDNPGTDVGILVETILSLKPKRD